MNRMDSRQSGNLQLSVCHTPLYRTRPGPQGERVKVVWGTVKPPPGAGTGQAGGFVKGPF